MELQQRIDAAVESHCTEALALLQEIVRIPSLSGQEQPVQAVLERELHRLGLELDVWDPPDEELRQHPAFVPTDLSYKGRPNVVGVLKGAGRGRSLILNGHVDVVPVGSEEKWTHSPWSADFEDGRVYGRGACDMKAGLVCNWLVVQALKTAGIRLLGDLTIEAVVDEENGGNGTLACLLRGYRADGMVFTEPSGSDRMAIANRGAQYFRLKVPGTEGGVEYKWDLVNPVLKAMEVIRAIEAYSVMREAGASHPYYDDFYTTKVPLAVCKIHAGDWPSTIASECVMEGTIECLPGEDIQQVKLEFRRYLEAWSARDPWLKDHPLELEWFGLWFDAAALGRDHPFVCQVEQTVERIAGARMLVGGAGGCDLRLPILYGQTPAVVFGPAGGPVHSTDEYVEFEQVVECARILVRLAVDWCGLAS